MSSVRTAPLAVRSVLALALLAGAPARAAGNLPALPGAGAPSAPAADAPPAAGQSTPDDAAPAGSAAPSAIDRVRRGVVLVERDGRLLGFGTVLGGDGRILTALSAIGPGDAADVRYADGALVHAKVGHRDPTWDLALLVPHAFHWKDGLSASEVDPSGTELPRAGPDARRREADRAPGALQGADGRDLAAGGLAHERARHRGAPRAADRRRADPRSAGHGRGRAGAGVQARRGGGTTQEAAKAGPIQCAPTLIGAPISAVRSFLARTPADAVPPVPPMPWLGIAGEPDDTDRFTECACWPSLRRARRRRRG